MREIKFRAWDTVRKKMFSGEEMGQDQEALLPDGRGFANISSTSTKLSQIHSHLLPLQYTSLKDKNGKEIYEGDIVRDFYHNILQVAWSDCWARYMMTYDGESCQYYLQDYHCNKTDQLAETMEVIGNIYENPELLEK